MMDDFSPIILWSRAFPLSLSHTIGYSASCRRTRVIPGRTRSKWGFDGHCTGRHGRSMSFYTVDSMSMRPLHWQQYEVRTNRQDVSTHRLDRQTLASYRDPFDAILARHREEE